MDRRPGPARNHGAQVQPAPTPDSGLWCPTHGPGLMAARRKPPVCPPTGHAPAPHGTRGKCPLCGRRRCHGKARGGGRCRLFPVTAALVCRSHGAAKGTKGRAAAEAREAQAKVEASAVRLLGVPEAVDHREAAVAELAASYGMVGWYRAEIAGLDRLTAVSERGESAVALVVLHAKAAEHLLRVIRLCHDMRIDQQMMDLARAHADQTDRILHALLRNLGHDPQDPAVRQAVRASLSLVEGGLGA